MTKQPPFLAARVRSRGPRGNGELGLLVRGALAAMGLDRLLAVFDRLEDVLQDGDPPLEPGRPGLAQA